MIHFRRYSFILISALLYIFFIPEQVRLQAADLSENMPEKYNLCDADINLATDVGNQGEYNTCWVYSALGSVQTQLKKKG